MRVTDAGTATVALLCGTFKLSRAAYYAEAQRARGEPETSTSSRAKPGDVIALPRRPRHTAADVVLDRIREVLARDTAAAWGVRKVWATLKREGLRVSRKRIWAIMHAHGLVLVRDREPGETPRGHVVVPNPNRRWATDLTTVWTRRDGTVALVPTIDCGCRSILSLVVTKDQHSPAVLQSVESALIDAFGSRSNVPDGLELRTDHGPQYTGSDCASLVDAWGLLHSYAPGRPPDRQRRRRARDPHPQGGAHLAA
jgi:transposase InsO family protein